MKVRVELPSGDSVCYSVDEQLDKLAHLQQRLWKEQGIPVEQQMLRTAHTRQPLADPQQPLTHIYHESAFCGEEMKLELFVALHGAGGSSCNVGNFEPAVKILCFQCSCTGEWKANQLCCCKCQCSIQ